MLLIRTPIAVITPIMEKTPTAIPRSVRAERSLFVRNAESAMRKLSLRLRTIFSRITFIAFAFYSYLSASTGSIFDARFAGMNPENTPTAREIKIARNITEIGIAVGSI